MPRGIWSKKDERQYEAVLKSCRNKARQKGKSSSYCKSMAAAVVNKRRVFEGRAKAGCHCPKGTRPLKSDKSKCYNPKTRKRVRRLCGKKATASAG